MRIKKDGVNLAAQIIFEEMAAGAGYHYLLGMITFALRFGALTQDECDSLIMYLNERG